jgi:small subunit ribosomal protein S1
VEGTVTRLVSFGAFVELNNGIEALLHISQMRAPAPQTPEEVVQPGDRLTTRIISLEPDRQRIGLSLLGLDDAAVESDDDPVAEADATSA